MGQLFSKGERLFYIPPVYHLHPVYSIFILYSLGLLIFYVSFPDWTDPWRKIQKASNSASFLFSFSYFFFSFLYFAQNAHSTGNKTREEIRLTLKGVSKYSNIGICKRWRKALAKVYTHSQPSIWNWCFLLYPLEVFGILIRGNKSSLVESETSLNIVHECFKLYIFS